MRHYDYKIRRKWMDHGPKEQAPYTSKTDAIFCLSGWYVCVHVNSKSDKGRLFAPDMAGFTCTIEPAPTHEWSVVPWKLQLLSGKSNIALVASWPLLRVLSWAKVDSLLAWAIGWAIVLCKNLALRSIPLTHGRHLSGAPYAAGV